MEESVDLAVTGMSCSVCTSRIERTLLRTPGVLAADVNGATDRARIRFATGTTTPGALVAAVQRAGYAATLPDAAAATGITRGARPG